MQARAPACEKLGCGDPFGGKGASNQTHSCWDRRGSLGVGLHVGVGNGQVVYSQVHLYLLNPQGTQSQTAAHLG